MRISDWSSDVCSSDLATTMHRRRASSCRSRAGPMHDRLPEIVTAVIDDAGAYGDPSAAHCRASRLKGMNMRKILLPACVLATALLPMSAMANRADSGFVRIEAGHTDAELEFDGQSASDADSSYSIRRSEERRGGNEWCRTGQSRGYP